MIRVMLVDDQELVRTGLRGILRARFGFEIVAECGDGSHVLAALRQSNPDVVLMDVRMPILDGVAATRQLHAEEPTTPILALTTFDDDEALAGMLRAGAAGFVLKGVPAEELQRAPSGWSPRAVRGSIPASLAGSWTFTAPTVRRCGVRSRRRPRSADRP